MRISILATRVYPERWFKTVWVRMDSRKQLRAPYFADFLLLRGMACEVCPTLIASIDFR